MCQGALDEALEGKIDPGLKNSGTFGDPLGKKAKEERKKRKASEASEAETRLAAEEESKKKQATVPNRPTSSQQARTVSQSRNFKPRSANQTTMLTGPLGLTEDIRTNRKKTLLGE